MQKLDMEVSVFGKHPSSSEYLYLGNGSEFTFSIILWIQSGYEALLKNRQKYSSDMIQHFYFSNKDTGSFVCASFKLSKDDNSREYPLVILVEVHETKQGRDYHSIWSKNLDILKSIGSLGELEDSLSEYEVAFNEKTFHDIDLDVISAFVGEDFSITKLFYEPLHVNDFIEIMR